MTIEHRHHARCACGSSLSAFASAPRPFVLSGTKRVYERPRPFTIKHIALDLELLLEEKSIKGAATIDFVRVDASAKELVLDAVGFEIHGVEIGGGGAARVGGRDGFAKVEHFYDGEALHVMIPESASEASIRVAYRAVPKRGMYFLAPDDHVRDRPRQVWTQCQDEDARHIFPCHDKPHAKQTTEVRVKVPAGWFALSNGERLSDLDAEARGAFHYRFDEPHPSYLFTLVAGEFTRLDDEAMAGDRTIPLAYYVAKGRETDGRRTFRRTADMIENMSRTIGVPYPWARYTQIVVSDFIFGGMENTTATTMYEHILLDDRAAIDVTSDDLIAHELAHQWFGDLVTCRDWSHAWLNEGFATFMEHIDREHHLGRDEYDYAVKGDAESYFAEARGRYRRPIVCHDYEAPIDIFDRHLYEKGGCVLHMLRRELGDGPFWLGVRAYLVRHAKGVVETRDLHRALEEASGRSLDRFFEQWVYRAGHPELEVKVEHDGGFCTVSVKQAHPPHPPPQGESPPPFAFDLAFDLVFPGESAPRREVRRVDQISQSFALLSTARPSFVVVDPEQAVIGEIRVEAPADMLRHQLQHAPTARGRMLAAGSLSKHDDPVTLQALAEALGREDEFWGVRAEVAGALGDLRSEGAFKALVAQVATRHPKVRRAVVHALAKFRTAKSAEALRPIALQDESYLVEAEAARSLGSTRQAAAFDVLVDILDRPAWADVIRAGALDGLADLRDDRAVPHVLARTRYGVSLRGRRAAILALPKLSTDRRTRETLEELLEQDDPYLRVDVVRALADLGDVKSRGALQRRLERELDGRVRRRIREVLRDLGSSAKREADRLRDELEALRGEHGDLRARVAKLEALANPKEALANPKKEVAASPSPKKEPEAPEPVRSKHRKGGKHGRS